MTTKLKIRDTDAVLIFRKDGIVEKLIPLDGPDEHNVFITEALCWASKDVRMMKLIAEAFVDATVRTSEPLRH
jgi:hypothetical protein